MWTSYKEQIVHNGCPKQDMHHCREVKRETQPHGRIIAGSIDVLD
jgi:hypothetical protein